MQQKQVVRVKHLHKLINSFLWITILNTVYMFIEPKSFFTRIVFFNTIFQAISTYILAVYYDGWQRLFKSFNYFGQDTTVYNRVSSSKSDEPWEDPDSV